MRSDGLDAVPVLQMHEMLPPGFQTSNEAVVRIVLKSLPQPDQSVALDEVVDFRSDKDAQQAVLRMRLRMTDLAKGEIDPIKARLTIASSISEYEESLRRNKIKTSRGTFEAIIVSSAEVLEDLVKFKWSAAAKAIFAIPAEKRQSKRVHFWAAEVGAMFHVILGLAVRLAYVHSTSSIKYGSRRGRCRNVASRPSKQG